MSKFTKLLKAIADPSREKILLALRKHEEITVGELVKIVKLAQPTVSQHLKILTEAGVLKYRKEKQEIYYSICNNKVCDMLYELMQMFKEKEKTL